MDAAIVKREFCDPVTLDIGGTISFSGGDPMPVTDSAVYAPACTSSLAQPIVMANILDGDSDDITYSDFRDPFYASTFPQCFALSAATVVAYMLLIMLLITPRSFLDGGVQVLGRRAGFTRSPQSAARIGGRPWLQKIAALTVAISLTITCSETFKEAELQYSWGVENAKTIQREVLGGTLLKVIRLISSTFLWCAQAQTLLRLFRRHREKMIIKWTAAFLITLDLIFDSLNSFLYTSVGNTRPSNFTQAIPALNYLFQLALGLLYAAWVIYYSIGKKKYAFYHRLMPNMALVALLSLVAIHVPVVFFILDIAKPDFAGWGDYVRWVGAAAASVLVWEWVERIEALEREDKKDGILGREIVDGDDMLDDGSLRRKKEAHLDYGRPGGRGGSNQVTRKLRRLAAAIPTPITRKRRRRPQQEPHSHNQQDGQPLENLNPSPVANSSGETGAFEPRLWPSRPPVARTPGGRTDSSSPNTVPDGHQSHVSRSLNATALSEPTPEPVSRATSRVSQRGREHGFSGEHSPGPSLAWGTSSVAHQPPADPCARNVEGTVTASAPDLDTPTPPPAPTAVEFEGGNQPPSEVAPHLWEQGLPRVSGSGSPKRNGSKWNLKARATEFTIRKIDDLRSKIRDEPNTRNLRTLVIPPPPGPAIENPDIQEELRNMDAPQGGHGQAWPRWQPPPVLNAGQPSSVSRPPSIISPNAADARSATAPPGQRAPSYEEAARSQQELRYLRSPSAPSEPAAAADASQTRVRSSADYTRSPGRAEGLNGREEQNRPGTVPPA